MSFPVLWSGFVSWVGASHRINLIAPFPLGQNCPRKMTLTMKNDYDFFLTLRKITSHGNEILIHKGKNEVFSISQETNWAIHES